MCNLGFTATPTVESCSGASDGQIAITNVTGGTGPFMYSINNGVQYFNTATFTGLSAGTYPVRVKDNFLCESTTFNVVVSVGSCPHYITGAILWEHDGTSGVQNTTVALSGDQAGSANTPLNGTYSFTINSGSNFMIKPTKNSNKFNGVTSADVTAIQQHVGNISLLPAPFKRIAADVNKSNSITSLDASILNQALLSNPSANAQFSTSWRFVPSAYTFPTPNVPWGFPEKITLTGAANGASGQNFKGIKIGDVTTAYANPANFGAGQPLVWRVEDRVLEPGSELVVDFNAGQMNDLASFQFALHFDPAQLQLMEIEPLPGLPVTIDHFGTYNITEGEIRMVWSQASGVSVSEGSPVFRLRFGTLAGGAKLSEVLQLDDEVLPGHSYNTSLAESGVELVFTATTGTPPLAGQAGLQLYQNRPNPFNGNTSIGFFLPEGCEAQLRVFDVSGRMLAERKAYYTAGKQEEIFDLDGAAGVLYYELVTPLGTLARKMAAIGQ